jgi:mono/diheme cytochrome c family protein
VFQGRLFRGMARAVLAAGLLIAFSLRADPPSEPAHLTPAESRGKIIYTTGRSASGRPLSFRLVSAGEGLLPAKGVACANCHGPDGKGGREGNAVIADITYGTLNQPLAASQPWDRERAAYTDALLARAITQGIDASGQRLNGVMPRWALPESDLQDLLKYLKRLGSK